MFSAPGVHRNFLSLTSSYFHLRAASLYAGPQLIETNL